MSLRTRPADARDADTLGEILWQSQHPDWMPELYSLPECVGYCEVMIERGWVTVALFRGQVSGFMARDGEEICALYLDRETVGQGIGTHLLAEAKTASTRLVLRCAEANVPARRFYARHGFVETGRSDGAAAGDNLPDITYVWPMEART